MVEPSFSTSCRARLQSGISPEWGSNKAKLGQFFDSRSRPSLTCLHDSSTDEVNWTKLANLVSSHQKSWDTSMRKMERIANAAQFYSLLLMQWSGFILQEGSEGMLYHGQWQVHVMLCFGQSFHGQVMCWSVITTWSDQVTICCLNFSV